MKWRRKRSDPSSIIASVFPVSWISKFKNKGANVEASVKEKQRGKVDFPTPASSAWREGRFYSMDEDDAYWRLSFTEERIEGRRSTGGLMNPLLYDSDDDAQVSFKSFSLRDEENRNFNDMVSEIKKMKDKEEQTKRESGELSSRKAKSVNESRSRKQSTGAFRVEETAKERGQDDMKSMEQADSVQLEDPNSRDSSGLRSIDEDCAVQYLNEDRNRAASGKAEWQSSEEKRRKRESRGKRSYTSTNSNSHKTSKSDGFKVYSPRMECKIRALEDMKKTRTKLRKEEEGGTMFDCYAVVKSSFNPQQDFRDSMVEMMMEKDIRHPQELEELLACYLAFNCDEYHDIIIKVFRQAWFVLNAGIQ